MLVNKYFLLKALVLTIFTFGIVHNRKEIYLQNVIRPKLLVGYTSE